MGAYMTMTCCSRMCLSARRNRCSARDLRQRHKPRSPGVWPPSFSIPTRRLLLQYVLERLSFLPGTLKIYPGQTYRFGLCTELAGFLI
jgi:hypothetical protein